MTDLIACYLLFSIFSVLVVSAYALTLAIVAKDPDDDFDTMRLVLRWMSKAVIPLWPVATAVFIYFAAEEHSQHSQNIQHQQATPADSSAPDPEIDALLKKYP